MKKILSLILLSLVFVLSSCSDKNIVKLELYSTTITEYLNTVVSLQIYHEESVDIKELMTEVDNSLKEFDFAYNAYSESSTLSSINKTAHKEPVKINDLMYEVIEKSLYYASLFDGAYDPTVLPLAKLWGINELSYLKGGKVPSQEEIDATLEVVGYEYVELNKENSTVYFTKEGVQLDLGSVVKGFVAEELKEILEKYGIKSALVDVGSSSQILIGSRAILEKDYYVYSDEYFRVGYADPSDIFGTGAYVGIYNVKDIAVSGTGISRQFFEEENGKIYHHIFDTSTGYPVENELESIQVFTKDYLSADALSTMLYVVGLEKAYEYVQQTDGLDAIFLTKDKLFFKTDNSPELNITNKDYKLRTYNEGAK